MLRPIIFLIFLNITAIAGKIMLNSFHHEDGWKEEIEFWGRTTCRAGRRRSFSVYERPHDQSNKHLQDFFSDLVTEAQTACSTTMKTTKSDIIIDDHGKSYQKFFDNAENFTTNPPEIFDEPNGIGIRKIDKKLYIFPHSDVEIVVTMVDDSARVLMDGKVFDNWNFRRHALLLMISRTNESPETSDSLIQTMTELLQRLWKERGILHIFIAAPLSPLGRLFWYYDPFFKNATSGNRGKIFARTIHGIPMVERVKDLQGYTLNIGMFEAPPAAIKNVEHVKKSYPFTKRSQHFVGLDGLTMATVASRMNFSVNIVPPSDGLEFGFVCVNGTFVGTIGDAAYHRIDIGFNSMYAKIYTSNEIETTDIEFTVPIDFDRLCVVVPRAPKIPRWLRTYYYFHPAIWMCLVLTQFLVSLVWYLLRNFHNPSRNPKNKGVSYHSILVDTFLVFIGAPLKINPSPAEKMFLTAFLLFGVTVMGMFAGTLYHSFTTDMRYREIANLKELDALGMEIGTTSPNLADTFGLDETIDDLEEIMSLKRKFKVLPYNKISTIERTAYNRNIASLSRENSFRVIRHNFVDESGHGLLHLIKDCPRSYYLSYIVPKDSIYIGRLNDVIMRLREAGLPPLWNSVTTNRLIAESVAASKKRIKHRRKSFNIYDMQTSFLLLLMGYAVSFCVLIVEIIYHEKTKGCGSRKRVRQKIFDAGNTRNNYGYVDKRLFNSPIGIQQNKSTKQNNHR